MIYWLTGQPGAGKTTLARAIKVALESQHVKVTWIDAHDWRAKSGSADYSEAGRRRNITDAQESAELLSALGDTVICSFVSPYRDLREALKSRAEVIEVYLHTTEVRGREHYHVKDYQPPLTNFVDIDTGLVTVGKAVEIVLSEDFQI